MECDIAAAFLALRESWRIADDADVVGGMAVITKPVIDPDTNIVNGETVGDATGQRVAVGGFGSARGSPVHRRTGDGPVPGRLLTTVLHSTS